MLNAFNGRVITALTELIHSLLTLFVKEEILLEYKPIHLCWWFEKNNLPIPKYFIAGTAPPSVTTNNATSILATSATGNGNLTSIGDGAVTARGFTFSQTSVNANPEIGGAGVTNIVEGGTATGVYSASLTPLVASTGYSFKAYATNNKGTGYGSALTFTSAAATASSSVSPSLSPSSSSSPSNSPSLSPSSSVSPSAATYTLETDFWQVSFGSPSASVSPSLSPSSSASPSISPSESPSLSPSASESPSLSPSASQSPSESPSLSPSASASPSLSPSLSPSQSPSISPSQSPSLSPSASASPSLSPSASVSPSAANNPLASLTDNFNDNSIDSGKWVLGLIETVGTAYDDSAGSIVTLEEVNQQIEISCPSGNAKYKGLLSANNYDFENSEAYVEVPLAQVLTTQNYQGVEFNMGPHRTGTGDPQHHIQFIREGTLLILRYTINGTANETSITYSATDHRWWKFEHTGTNILWRTSTDGATWTTRRTITASTITWDKTSVRVNLVVGAWTNQTTTTAIGHFDNFSLQKTASSSISPSESPSHSPSVSPSLSPSASISPSISPSQSPSLSPSASISPSLSPSESPSLSPSATESPSVSPSESPSLSPSSSISPSFSPSESPSLSPSASISPSQSPSLSPSASLSPSTAPSITPILLTGFEQGVISETGGGLAVYINDPLTTTISTVEKNSGNYALKVNISDGQAEFVRMALPTAPDQITGRIYWKLTTAPPTDTVTILDFTTTTLGTSSTPRITLSDAIDSGGTPKVELRNGSTVIAIGPTWSDDGNWHYIDFHFDSSSGTWTMKAKVDGGTEFSGSFSRTADTFSNVRVGSPNSTDIQTAEWYLDDLVLTADPADYPIGPGGTEVLTPSSDGTHSIAADTLEDQTGADINGTTVTAYNLINSVPPSSTTYIRQATLSTGSYAEVLFSNISASHDSIIGARAVLAYTSETTTTNSGATMVSKDGFSTKTDVWGNNSTPADMSDGSTSNLFYKTEIIAGVVDDTTVNALSARVGYSANATPDPYWVDLLVEVAYTSSVSSSQSPSASPSLSPSASVSPSESPSLSPSASQSPSLSPSTLDSASVSPSESPSESPSVSPSEPPPAPTTALYNETVAATTATTSWVDLATISASSFTAGHTYLIIANQVSSNSSGSAQTQARLVHGTTPTVFDDASLSYEGGADTQKHELTWLYKYTQPGTTELVKIQFSSDTATVTNILSQIIALDLGDIGVSGTDYVWAEDLTDYTLTTSPTAKATTTSFTPNGTDRWLFLSQMIWDVQTTGTTQIGFELYDSVAGVLNQGSQEGEDITNDTLGAMQSWVGVPTNAARTLSIRPWQDTTADAIMLSGRVIAINLSSFAQSYSTFSATEVNPAATPSFTTLATIAPNPSVTGEWVVMAFANEDVNGSTTNFSSRLQINASGGGLVDNPAYSNAAPQDDHWDLNDEIPFNVFKLVTLSSGAGRTINYDWSTVLGGGSQRVEDSGLVAFSVALATTESSSVSPSVSPSLSPSASISPSLSPSESPSLSPSASISPSLSPSESPSLSPSASISPSLSPSESPSFSPSASISPSLSPSVSPSLSPSASISPSISPSQSPSLSPSASVSPSVSPSQSPSLSPSASISPSLSPSVSPSLSPSASISPSLSPSESPSLSPSASISPSLSPSESPSLSPSASISPSLSPSESPSLSPSASKSPSTSPSPSPSSSASVSPSASPSLSPSATESPSVSPSASESPSFSPSASVSPSPSPGFQGYTRGNYASLPTDNADLETGYSGQDITNVATKDDIRVAQTGTTEYVVHQYKDYVGTNTVCTLECELQSTIAPSSQTVFLQIYNLVSPGWETVDSEIIAGANTDFILTANIPDLTNYKDGNSIITCRVYQLVI